MGNQQYELVFQGAKEGLSEEDIRELKVTFISELKFTVEEVREFLENAPLTILSSDNSNELELYSEKLRLAGGEVLLIRKDGEEIDNDAEEELFALSFEDETPQREASTKVYELPEMEDEELSKPNEDNSDELSLDSASELSFDDPETESVKEEQSSELSFDLDANDEALPQELPQERVTGEDESEELDGGWDLALGSVEDSAELTEGTKDPREDESWDLGLSQDEKDSKEEPSRVESEVEAAPKPQEDSPKLNAETAELGHELKLGDSSPASYSPPEVDREEGRQQGYIPAPEGDSSFSLELDDEQPASEASSSAAKPQAKQELDPQPAKLEAEEHSAREEPVELEAEESPLPSEPAAPVMDDDMAAAMAELDRDAELAVTSADPEARPIEEDISFESAEDSTEGEDYEAPLVLESASKRKRMQLDLLVPILCGLAALAYFHFFRAQPKPVTFDFTAPISAPPVTAPGVQQIEEPEAPPAEPMSLRGELSLKEGVPVTWSADFLGEKPEWLRFEIETPPPAARTKLQIVRAELGELSVRRVELESSAWRKTEQGFETKTRATIYLERAGQRRRVAGEARLLVSWLNDEAIKLQFQIWKNTDPGSSDSFQSDVVSPDLTDARFWLAGSYEALVTDSLVDDGSVSVEETK